MFASLPDNQTLTAVPGIQVGHAHDSIALTGCTVVLCPEGTVAGVDVRGGAPGTRETDALGSNRLVSQANAILLAGGSAFGLDAAAGVMRFLAEREIGFDTGLARIPIVPAAILYDLGVGSSDTRPDVEMGYQACQNAGSGPVPQGCVGAGTGASVGKGLGMAAATKAGIGSAAVQLGGGLVIAALVAVNAFGDVVDPRTSRILAGPRAGGTADSPFSSTLDLLASFSHHSASPGGSGQNTVIGVVATNARLGKPEVNKTAEMAHAGLARAVHPCHTLLDGDTLFALATGQVSADVNVVGAFAAEVVAQAIVSAVRHARSAGGLPAPFDLGLHF